MMSKMPTMRREKVTTWNVNLRRQGLWKRDGLQLVSREPDNFRGKVRLSFTGSNTHSDIWAHTTWLFSWEAKRARKWRMIMKCFSVSVSLVFANSSSPARARLIPALPSPRRPHTCMRPSRCQPTKKNKNRNSISMSTRNDDVPLDPDLFNPDIVGETSTFHGQDDTYYPTEDLAWDEDDLDYETEEELCSFFFEWAN
ncbi:hypothetical protein VP01_1642g1 [Puccinia sorghi]|uniref:Uncharacterized protein n=1 Tax=Puccinia sorghi TaxID=27349 RepID=A0A0L6VGM5_9BASI|nr:hypothetical protein VP01_1642g1 [Puccinia sorghi]